MLTPDEEWALYQKWEKMDDASAYWDYQKEKMKAFYKWTKAGKDLSEFKFLGKHIWE